jgi:NitT/TauT family transport system substrate-binding protein
MNNQSLTIRAGSLVAASAALVLALSACSSGQPTPASADSAEETTAITVGAVFTTAAVPLWIAEQQGIFEEHGLDVTITQSPNFAASAPSLLNGQMHFANAATAPVITAIDKGVPIQVVAGVSAEPDDPAVGDDQVTVTSDSDIERPRDLEGKTVAVNAIGSGPYVGVMANYLADGGAPDGINWVALNLNEQIPALETGQIDAAVLSEPFAATARSAGFANPFNAYRVEDLDVIPAGFTDAVLVASNQYAAQNADVVARMHDAMVEANEFAQENPDAVRAILVDKLELDPAVAEAVYLPAFIGEVDSDNVQAMIDAMTAVGLITNEIDAAEIVWQP